MEITFCKVHTAAMKRVTTPDISDKELGEGKRNVCPLQWTKGHRDYTD